MEELNYWQEGTPSHNFIVGNLLVKSKFWLEHNFYDIFILNQRLWIPDRSLYTYPDIMVLEKPIQLQENRTDAVTNSCLIAEVLSKSTKDYDRSEKFQADRTVETFQEYLLIDQYKIQVEHYVKTGVNQWLFSEYTNPETTLNLNSINLE